jgi:hypothetical protein
LFLPWNRAFQFARRLNSPKFSHRAGFYFLSANSDPARGEAKMLAAHFSGDVFQMLFDVITGLTLFLGFTMLSRLVARRRGDVLRYVSRRETSRWRASPRGAVRINARLEALHLLRLIRRG